MSDVVMRVAIEVRMRLEKRDVRWFSVVEMIISVIWISVRISIWDCDSDGDLVLVDCVEWVEMVEIMDIVDIVSN